MTEHLNYSEWEEKIKKNDIWSVFYKDIMRDILNDWEFDHKEKELLVNIYEKLVKNSKEWDFSGMP